MQDTLKKVKRSLINLAFPTEALTIQILFILWLCPLSSVKELSAIDPTKSPLVCCDSLPL